MFRQRRIVISVINKAVFRYRHRWVISIFNVFSTGEVCNTRWMQPKACDDLFKFCFGDLDDLLKSCLAAKWPHRTETHTERHKMAEKRTEQERKADIKIWHPLKLEPHIIYVSLTGITQIRRSYSSFYLIPRQQKFYILVSPGQKQGMYNGTNI